MKNEIQIGLEIQNSNLSALVYTAAMVYTVVYTAAAMVYTVVYTAAAAGIYRGIYCGIYWYIGIYRSYIPVFTRAAIIPEGTEEEFSPGVVSDGDVSGVASAGPPFQGITSTWGGPSP